jgi:hypothetical protein
MIKNLEFNDGKKEIYLNGCKNVEKKHVEATLVEKKVDHIKCRKFQDVVIKFRTEIKYY